MHRSQLFELADETTENDIKDNIIYNIETYEPRAQLVDILVNYRPNQNSVEVTIEFQVVNSQEIVTFTTVLSRLR